MELDPVNISPLPVGMILSFVSRGHQRATARGSVFSPWTGVLLLSSSCSTWLLQCLASEVNYFSNTQQPTVARGQKLPWYRDTSLWTTPPAAQRVDLPQVPLAQHLSRLIHHSGSHSLDLPTRSGSTLRWERAPSWVHHLSPSSGGYYLHLLFLPSCLL